MGLQEATDAQWRIGVDVGGTKIEAVRLDGSYNVVSRKRVAAPQNDLNDTVETITRLVGDVESAETARRGGGGDATVGIGMPGSPSSEYAAYIRKGLEESLSRRVFVENDANCFTLAEATMGAGWQYRTVFGIIMGTGVGGGIVIDGAIQDGRMGLAGEWGHATLYHNGVDCSCGRKGCTIMYISGPALERRWTEITGGTETVPAIVASPSLLESENGLRWKEEFLDDFGTALAGVISILDPDVIVVGGGVSNIRFLYDEGVESVRRHSLYGDRNTTPILQNRLGDSSGMLGAAVLGGFYGNS